MNTPSQQRDHYLRGFILCLILTLVAFGAVASDIATNLKMWIIGITAIAQIIFQFHYFLHIDHTRQSREDLQLILFTLLLLSIMIIGSIWVLGSLETRMMIMNENGAATPAH